MFKRILTGAVLALATAGFATAAVGGIHVATFESHSAFHCDAATTEHDNGLSFAQDPLNPNFSCFYSPAHPADFPITPPSTVMAVGFNADEVPSYDPAPFDMMLTRIDGSVFDLLSLDIATGPFVTPGASTVVTGFVHGGGQVTQTVGLTEDFATLSLNWLGLDAVVFGPPSDAQGFAYIAYDNVTYRSFSGPVPEPAEWALLLTGLLGSGFMLRRARQLAAVEA